MSAVTPSSSSENRSITDDAVFPHFKWGQTKEKVFVTIAVRNLDRESVRLSFEEDRLRFSAVDSGGKVYELDLELAQDVLAADCKWEQMQRKDRWGDAVMATLTKVFPVPWAMVAVNQARYRQVIDRDWSRDDEKLDAIEEDGFFEEHAAYLPQITQARVDEELVGVDVLVIHARHAACKMCSAADGVFAKVADKVASEAPKQGWQSRVRMRALDPRVERQLARQLGVFCASEPRECRHFVLAPGGGRKPMMIRGRHDEANLLADLERLARPQFEQISASAALSRGVTTSRSLVVLAPDAAESIRHAAHQLRLRLDVAVAEDAAAAAELGIAEGEASLWAWRAGEVAHRTFRVHEASSEQLRRWLAAVSVPALANTSKFEDDEPYEELGLPLARLFLDGSYASVDALARQAVNDLARDFFGRVSFVERDAREKVHDWRLHGLPPGQFPGFALAADLTHNASRHALLGHSHTEFWARSDATKTLSEFLEDALAGRLEESRMSEAPPDETGEELERRPGSVRKLVGRQCRHILEASQTEVLIEAYDEWRRDHSRRTLQLDTLAPMLAQLNITVYRLDLGYNECPRDLLPIIAAGYSGYFFVQPRARELGHKTQRLKKLDPDFGKVLNFVQKHSSAKPDASRLLVDFESAMSILEGTQADWLQGWGAQVVAGVIGLVGVLSFRLLRARARSARTSPQAPAATSGASS